MALAHLRPGDHGRKAAATRTQIPLIHRYHQTAQSEILESFKNDNDVRVVVLTGAGGKSFVSGADISKFESERSSLEGMKTYNETVARANEGVAIMR